MDGDDRLKTVCEVNAPLILENYRESSVSSTNNVPVNNDFTMPQLIEHAERINDRHGYAFRLNLEFELILRLSETGEYRYFKPFANESLFERPVYISMLKDLNRLKLRLQRFDETTYILKQTLNTMWKPYSLTNLRFILFHLIYPLGHAGNNLPGYITSLRSTIALNNIINVTIKTISVLPDASPFTEVI